MDFVSHCDLCNLQKKNDEGNTLCALTKAKPDFGATCPDIQWEGKLGQKIKEVNIAYESARRKLKRVSLKYALFLGIGIVIAFSGYFTMTYANTIISILIILFGVGTSFYAFKPLYTYQRNLVRAKKKKQKLDELLKRYHRSYTIGINLEKGIHGDREADVTLEVKKTFVSPYEQIH